MGIDALFFSSHASVVWLSFVAMNSLRAFSPCGMVFMISLRKASHVSILARFFCIRVVGSVRFLFLRDLLPRCLYVIFIRVFVKILVISAADSFREAFPLVLMFLMWGNCFSRASWKLLEISSSFSVVAFPMSGPRSIRSAVGSAGGGSGGVLGVVPYVWNVYFCADDFVITFEWYGFSEVLGGVICGAVFYSAGEVFCA